ncbi:hypothetical protein COCCADRAFT_96195 [Bipolaris zeicola 26-R-13]|uniref:Amine oxidase n=1 Tax=Cochliobolus carbonum (strain 26-R-13) TaxID=930089 RepID=W6YPQ2_COCC2|nr:uncharacterized protein COCCADRAFT_96195 [Bipolaris zeicola 26-R-13]EUC33421.1 hypothetical protein COCCADRAFT_96195 [Bipolaris zeicola 26-R-13]
MKLRMILICTILFMVTAFGQSINNEQVVSVSNASLEGTLLDSSVIQDALPVKSSAARSGPFNPALGEDYDPEVFASNQLWEERVTIGSYMFCLMMASDTTAGMLMEDDREPPSAFSAWAMHDINHILGLWGWFNTPTAQGRECDFRSVGLQYAFEGLGLNYEPKYDDGFQPANGENVCFSILHWNRRRALPDNPRQQPLSIREQLYRTPRTVLALQTGATYEFAVNIRDGAIVARTTMSPSAAVRHPFSWGREARPQELPELQHVTDIYWGFWKMHNPNVRNFRVYGVQDVIEDHTVLLVARALRNRRKFALEIWPGVMFEKGSEEFMALIGSPIGKTIAGFLITHKPWLGLKYITHVIVVCDGNDQDRCTRGMGKMHLFFTIDDVHFENEQGSDQSDGNGETGQVESHVFQVRDDGKHVIREHKVTANL